MNLIKVGIEASRKDLRQDLLSNPGRYFFISMLDHRACLCIRTCDNRGDNLQSHIVDGFTVDSAGHLVSIFEDVLERAGMNAKSSNLHADCEDQIYPISSAIAEKISALPGLIDWIMSSILTKGRNIAIYPTSWQSQIFVRGHNAFILDYPARSTKNRLARIQLLKSIACA